MLIHIAPESVFHNFPERLFTWPGIRSSGKFTTQLRLGSGLSSLVHLGDEEMDRVKHFLAKCRIISAFPVVRRGGLLVRRNEAALLEVVQEAERPWCSAFALIVFANHTDS